MSICDWDERYRSGEHASDAPHPVLVDYAGRLPAGRALDLACGLGRHALWLAQRGWNVTAVDSSATAIDILRRRAQETGAAIDARQADLEQQEFVIEPDSYDLILKVRYLQRDLFPSICAGVRPGGVFLGVIAMADDDSAVSPMNPDYLLEPNELRSYFSGWELLHDNEVKRDPRTRAMAEIVARCVLNVVHQIV